MPDPSSPPSDPTSCTYPMRACGAGCVDTSSDPRNCGSCGLDCGGSPCIASLCAPSAPPPAPSGPTDQCDNNNASACPGDGVFCDTSGSAAICNSCPTGLLNCDGVGDCECPGSCNAGGQCDSGNGGANPPPGAPPPNTPPPNNGGPPPTGTSATWDVVVVSVLVSARNASGSDWDSYFGDPRPDPYVGVKLDSLWSLSYKATPIRENTLFASWNTPVLTGVSTADMTQKGVKVVVRDSDSPGGYTYNTIGDCGVIRLTNTQSTHDRLLNCGPQVFALWLRFVRVN